MAGYHQFHAVKAAVEETLRATELQRAQAKLRETAQDPRDLEMADAVDELHTELWFWQSAMGYPDNATVNVTVLGEQRPRPQSTASPSGAGRWPEMEFEPW